jgi:serine protease Do
VVFADEREYAARIVSTSIEHDLAVLKIEAEGPLKAIRFGRSDDLMVGETVVAIGNALGYQHTVTSGVVSAVDRELTFGNGVTYKNLIQTDASINPGNSGGPLLNIHGQLIGINTAIRGDAQNIGFAIPVDELVDMLPRMLNIEQFKRVQLGMEVRGRLLAMVSGVAVGGPAATAGLRAGDVLISLDGQPIRNAVDFYVGLLGKDPGRQMRIGYRRNDKSYVAVVTLRSIPKPDGEKLARSKLGIGVRPLPARDARQIRLSPGQGLRVVRVESGGPADRIGIEAGDVLVQVDGYNLSSLDDLGRVLEGTKRGDSVIVKVVRVYSQSYEFLRGECPVR